MKIMRRTRTTDYLQPDGLTLRTIRSPFHLVLDEATNTFRVSSAAFGPTDDGSVSIDLEQLLTEDELPQTALYPSMTQAVGLVAHRVGFVRQQSLAVHHEPVTRNWYHGGIRGGFSKKAKRDLAKNCIPIVPIDVQAARKHWDSVKSGSAI